MNKSKTLYKKSSKGKILQWNIIVDGATFWCEYGQLGGKIQSDTPTTCTGKNIGRSNETSPEQQAQLEADAKFTKQKDIKGYVEDIEETDTFSFTPMLAHKYTEHGHKMPEYMDGSPKLDGVRCFITKDGAFSRNGKRWVSTRIIEEFLVDFFKDNPSIVLDGEIYNHKYKDNFNEIVSLIKRLKNFTDEQWVKVEQELEFHVFDYYDTDTPEEKFSGRYSSINAWFGKPILLKEAMYESKYIKVVPNVPVTKENYLETYAKFMELGYEGIMLRDPESVYECKRSYSLLKYKEFQDSEYEIIDIEEGTGKRSGMFGRMIVKVGDKTCEANARGNEEYYRELLRNKENYIGKMATIRYQGITPDGMLRFPVCLGIRDYE